MNFFTISAYSSIDILCVVLISIYTFAGLYYGLLKTLCDNCIFVLSILMLSLMYPYSKNFLNFYVENTFLLFILHLVTLYLVFIVFTRLVKAIVHPLVENFKFGFMNNFLGACMGFTKGVVLLLIAFTLFVILNLDLYKHDNVKDMLSNLEKKSYPLFLTEARLFSILDSYMKGLIVYIPDSIIDKVKNLKLLYND